MTPTETTSRLRRLADDWRKEERQLCEQFGNEIVPHSMRARKIKDTKAIGAAVEMIDRLEAAESDALEQARLNGVGASREAALMAKLEAAEKDIALKERIIDALGSTLNAVANERDALRTELADLRSGMTFRTSLIGRIEAERDALQAKIDAMERQEPVAIVESWVNGSYSRNYRLHWHKDVSEGAMLYLAPGAQPAPSDEYVGWYCAHCERGVDASEVTYHGQHEACGRVITDDRPPKPAPIEQDTSVRKAWARFSNELHRSPDAPYPGMSEAFERHFSQSFTDREWRTESGVWAAAWKAAKNHGAQPAPSVPECPYPCGWRNLLKLAIEDGAYLARHINEDEPVTENARFLTMLMVSRLRDVLIAVINAAPESPAQKEKRNEL